MTPINIVFLLASRSGTHEKMSQATLYSTMRDPRNFFLFFLSLTVRYDGVVSRARVRYDYTV